MTRYRIAIDTGGTFTDVLLWDSQNGEIRTEKVPSTPIQPEQAFLTGVRTLAVKPAAIAFLGHGTTVAINTLVQRKGQNRSDHYGWFPRCVGDSTYQSPRCVQSLLPQTRATYTA